MIQIRGLFQLLTTLLLASAALLAPRPAQAVYGASDNAPAATVLIPYFEVDLNNVNGRTTLVALTNASASAALTNVVIWSDQGIPAASFNVYLTGFDVQSFNVRDVLNGVLPRTATDGQDPMDTISPQGQQSQDINFASCNGIMPYSAGAVANFPGPTAAPPTPADVRAMLTGLASTVTYPGQCVGAARGDGVARGYITIDSVVQCTSQTPANLLTGYADAIDHRNILLGEFYLVDPSTDQAVGIPAVQVESNFVVPANQYSFYGAYNGFNANDRREPLPTNWRASVENNSSEVLVWRDPKVASQPRACGAAPTYGALPIGDTSGVSAFGTESSFFPITGGTLIAPNVTQRIPVASTPFTGLPSVKLGSMNFSFNHSGGGGPAADPAAAGSYVIVLRAPENNGVFNLAVPATALDTGLGANHFHPRQF